MFFGSGFGHLSKVHKKIRTKLNLDKHGFTSEQPLLPYIVDELHPQRKIIIEINGDYIHANPKKYKSTDIIRIPGLAYTAQEKWSRDKNKINHLTKKGYQVLVIWESDDLEFWKQKLQNIFA